MVPPSQGCNGNWGSSCVKHLALQLTEKLVLRPHPQLLVEGSELGLHCLLRDPKHAR